LDNDNNLSLSVGWWFAAGTDFTSGTLATSWGNHSGSNRAVGQVNLADSTSNYINITGVQLEVGEGASDFEHLPYDVQLQRCQRYYSELKASNAYTGFGAGVCRSATTVSYMVDYPKTMRAAPTIAISGTIVMVAGSANGNISGIGATYPGLNSALLQSTGLSGSADGRGLCVHAQNDTSAKFTFSAEL